MLADRGVQLAQPLWTQAGRAWLDGLALPAVVVQVKADTSLPEQARPTVVPYKGRGRRPQPRYRQRPRSLKQLALAAGQRSCIELIWRRGSKGPQRSLLGVAGPPGRDHPAPAGCRACGRQWQLLGQLQVLLACWAGACSVCHRPAPRWLHHPGQARTPA